LANADEPTEAPTAAAARYVDVEEFLSSRGGPPVEQWSELGRNLKQSFDDLCGDTFCSGDYSNLESLRLRCAVHSTTGVLKNCTYVFAGSYETVNPTTGAIKVNAKTFSCHVPVAGIALDAFVATLAAPGTTTPLQRPLPGGTRSIYDALANCL
jgi:hypothetical protein